MRILLVDYQTLIRKGVASILSHQEGVEALEEAKSSRDALSLISSFKPDLVLTDLHIGSDCGLRMMAEARNRGCRAKFAILTSSSEPADFEHARAMNVDGYISKEALPEELIHALHLIQRGRKYYDPEVFDQFMQKKELEEITHVEQLTYKEKEVLRELGMGLSNKQISERLFISENTVKKHVSQVLSKLNLADRTHAALYANATGLVQYQIS